MMRVPAVLDLPQGALRIGVNLFPLTRGGGGMRQYVMHLLPWLVRLSPHRFLLFHGLQGQPSVAQILRRLQPAERNRVVPIQFEDQEQIFRHAHKFDVAFCPLNCLAPDLLDRPSVATLADVQEQFFPNYFTSQDLRDRAEYYPHTAHASTVLLTISEFSKSSICSAFGVPPDKVVVTQLTPSVIDVAPDWPSSLPPLPEHYFFYPANLYPHKNHVLLLDALSLVEQRGLDCSCVLTGQAVQPGIDIHKEIAARGLDGKVVWLEHVAPAALRHLYENAVAMAFPSLFEGFGLPLVEAMACGCPVIATPVASIPEVAGDAALLVPGAVADLADALCRLLTDARLRQDLIVRGQVWAKQFSPVRLAEQTLAAIDLAVTRFVQPRPTGPAAPTVSYVVRPTRGGRGLTATLASLSFEVTEHDEILVLAKPDEIGRDAETLAANLGMVRFASGPRAGGAWLVEAGRDIVCHLNEGDRLAEGATQAVLNAFAEHPEAQAVVGQALGSDRRRRLTGVRYRPAHLYRPPAGGFAPSAAVFWKRSWLLQQRAALDDPRWADRLLRLAGPRAHSLNRTVAYVPSARPLVRPFARALAANMPRWMQELLRSVYLRMARPGLAPK